MKVHEDTRKAIREELNGLCERIRDNIVTQGRNASGRTARSLRVTEEENTYRVLGRFPFADLETGRKAGAVPRGFYYIILQWIKDKRINVQNPRQMAYFTARKIAREGSRLHRQGAREDIYTPEIPETIERVRKILGSLYSANITDILRNGNNRKK